MYGFPKKIKTRKDIYTLIGYLNTGWATEENVERGLNYLKGLRDNVEIYMFDRILDENEEPDGTMPQYKVMEDDETGERQQFILQKNPNAPLFRLGFTVDEIQKVIEKIEGEQ